MTVTPTEVSFDPRWADPSQEQFGWDRGRAPVTRLYQDVLRAYYAGQRRCWDAVGSPMARTHIIHFANGWPYLRGPEFDAAAGERLERHRQRLEAFPEHRAGWYEMELKPEVVAIVERLRKHPRPSRPLMELVAHLDECVDAFAHIMGDLHWRMAAGVVPREGGKPTFEWPKIYSRITGRPETEGATLVGGLTNELTRTITRMRKLARTAQSDPSLLAALFAGDLSAIERDDRPAFKRFRSGFRSLLRRYGHRTGAGWGSNLDIGSATWNVRPEIPLQMIATYARSDLDEVERKERDAAKERKTLLRQIRRDLKGDPARLTEFEEELEKSRFFAYFLEDHNDWMDQSAPGIVRDAAHVVALRLVRDGALDDPEDVVHLSLEELRSLPRDVRTLVEERKREHEENSKLDPPQHLGPGEGGPPPVMHDEGEGRIGNALHGVAASSGRYTGRARVFLPRRSPPTSRTVTSSSRSTPVRTGRPSSRSSAVSSSTRARPGSTPQ